MDKLEEATRLIRRWIVKRQQAAADAKLTEYLSEEKP